MRIRDRASLLVLLGCAVIAWYFTILAFGAIPPESGGMALSFVGFLAAWMLMMSAMMLPSLAPLTAVYLRSIRKTGTAPARAARTTALVMGYLASWAAFGAIAFATAVLAAELAMRAPEAAPWVGAGAVAIAGTYQLTPLKDFCLRHCRSPVAFLLHVAGYKGPLRDLRAGIYHGLYCIGCCWGLMVVLMAVGMMNLWGMAVISVAVVLEKTWSRGRALSRIIGVALIVLAFFVPGNPALLPGLHMTSGMQAPAVVVLAPPGFVRAGRAPAARTGGWRTKDEEPA